MVTKKEYNVLKKNYIIELQNSINILEQKGHIDSAEVLKRHLSYATNGTIDDLITPEERLSDVLVKAAEISCNTDYEDITADISEIYTKIRDRIHQKSKVNRPVFTEDAKMLKLIGAYNASEILYKAASIPVTSSEPKDGLFWQDAKVAYIQKQERFNDFSERVKQAVVTNVQIATR